MQVNKKTRVKVRNRNYRVKLKNKTTQSRSETNYRVKVSRNTAGCRSTKRLDRVATAQGKQGIWFLLFPDRENTGNFVLTHGKIC